MTPDLLSRALDALIAGSQSSQETDELAQQFRDCARLHRVIYRVMLLGIAEGNPSNSIYAILHLGYQLGREVEQLEQLERMTK